MKNKGLSSLTLADGLIISGVVVIIGGIGLIADWGLNLPDEYPLRATVAAVVGLILLLAGVILAAREDRSSLK